MGRVFVRRPICFETPPPAAPQHEGSERRVQCVYPVRIFGTDLTTNDLMLRSLRHIMAEASRSIRRLEELPFAMAQRLQQRHIAFDQCLLLGSPPAFQLAFGGDGVSYTVEMFVKD